MYALLGVHPPEPVVVRAAATRADFHENQASLDEHARRIWRTILEYEDELRTYQAGR